VDELVHDPCRQPLPDQVGSAAERHGALARELTRLGHRRLEAVDEEETGRGVGLVLGPVREHDQRAGERVGPTPRAGALVHRAADDPAAQTLGEAVEELLVGAVHPLGVVAVVGVGPRTAHDPVVEALAPDAEALARVVVRPDDVPVERDGDGGNGPGHATNDL